MLENQNYILFMYYNNLNTCCGLIICLKGPFETDIIYLYVYPKNRKQGIASKLILHLLSCLKEDNKQEGVFLEVSDQNKSAIKLYEKIGMTYKGLRRSYYKDGSNALVYYYSLK